MEWSHHILDPQKRLFQQVLWTSIYQAFSPTKQIYSAVAALGVLFPSYITRNSYFFYLKVSWVRNLDSHMLFIGRDRFVHDDRYELISSRHGRWTLKLKYVTARDAGRFECQVSTVPKLNQTFSLKVVGKFNWPSCPADRKWQFSPPEIRIFFATR